MPRTIPAAEHLDTIASRFAAGFPEGPATWRTVGREAEYPIVREDGTAVELAALWPLLAELSAERGLPLLPKREGRLVVALEGQRFTYFSEVGRGTIEVLTGPHDDLWQIADDHELAVEILLDALSVQGWTLLGYGTQPLSPPTPALMTHKSRYGVLLQVLGDPWLWFTLTASDQIHASVRRHEVAPLASICNLLAPVTVALCANSPIYAGSKSGFCCARESHMGQIHARDHRHGMPAGPFQDIREMIGHLARQPFIMERRQQGGVWSYQPGALSFGTWLEHHGADPEATGRQPVYDAFEFHEHYIWNSARPRSNHGTIELRAACQQPWTERGLASDGHRRADHMAASALGVAMICAGADLATLLQRRLGDTAWHQMRHWHQQVIVLGLDAPEPVPGLLGDVLDRCEAGLAARGRGEERLLRPLRHRLSTRQSPAQRALDHFDSGGIDALIDGLAIR
ncbi:MAG: hypothetical protein GXP62_21815 [Oligoflexia bacterium]|nr:hypothetical protein [Oligoflexia bacterium]